MSYPPLQRKFQQTVAIYDYSPTGNSCVQSIDVNSTGIEAGSNYHFKINLSNGSQCSFGKLLVVIVPHFHHIDHF